MSSLLRPALLLALVSLAVASTLPACSQQGEGERCDLVKNGDADCDSGLVCVAQARLRDHSADRCCAPNGASTDARCDPDSPNGTGGTGGTGGGGGKAGSDNSAAGAGATSGEGGVASSSGGKGGSGGSGGTTPSGGAPDSAGNGGQADGGALSMDPGAGRGGA